jgi:hypothetical protein
MQRAALGQALSAVISRFNETEKGSGLLYRICYKHVRDVLVELGAL